MHLAHRSFLLHDKVGSCSDGGEDCRTYNKVLHGIAFSALFLHISLLISLLVSLLVFFCCYDIHLLTRLTFGSFLEALKGFTPVLKPLRIEKIAREV